MPSVKVSQNKHFIWTELDSWGIPFGVKRLPMESNYDFKTRLMAAIAAHGDASKQGLVDGLSALFGLETYNVEDKRHFYLNLLPEEYDADGNPLDVLVYIDNVAQTQNIEYQSPKDWMYGGRDNYVFADNATGFIIWRDNNGKYTKHLEFLTAPATGTELRVEYWTKVDTSYVKVVETVEENPDLVPKSAETPSSNQLSVHQLFDSDYMSEHLTADGTPDDTLQNIIDDASSPYPSTWGSFIWDKYRWDINTNQGLLPTYYDAATHYSGEFVSGTGIGDDLKIEQVGDDGIPQLHPGYFYYDGKEHYCYKKMNYQEVDNGVYDVTLVDESGNYVDITRPAPVVVKADVSQSLIVGPNGSGLTGQSEIFTYDPADPNKTVFQLTVGTPASDEYMTVKRYNAGNVMDEVGWIYTSAANTVTITSPLTTGQSLLVTWPEANTRYVAPDTTEAVHGPNLVRTHEEGFKIPMTDMMSIATLDDNLVIVANGAHGHYVKLTDPYDLNGVLEPEVYALESGNVAPIMGINTPWIPNEFDNMLLESKDHTHTIVNGSVQSASITLNNGESLSHTHSLNIPNGYGWRDPTPDILPHKPNPKSFTLDTPAAQSYLATAWDNLTLDIETYRYGSYTAKQEGGSLRIQIDNSFGSHTVFYEKGTYSPNPEDDIFTPIPGECPSLYQAQGKILAIGRNLPAFFINVYPEHTAINEWDKQWGITIEALDTEGLGLVKGCEITLSSADNKTVIDMMTDKAITNEIGRVYIRPKISEGNVATTKGSKFEITVTGVFTTKDQYTAPLPNNVTETITGPEGDKTYTYTVTSSFFLRWIG